MRDKTIPGVIGQQILQRSLCQGERGFFVVRNDGIRPDRHDFDIVTSITLSARSRLFLGRLSAFCEVYPDERALLKKVGSRDRLLVAI